jgi:hypothetical protein
MLMASAAVIGKIMHIINIVLVVQQMVPGTAAAIFVAVLININ